MDEFKALCQKKDTVAILKLDFSRISLSDCLYYVASNGFIKLAAWIARHKMSNDDYNIAVSSFTRGYNVEVVKRLVEMKDVNFNLADIEHVVEHGTKEMFQFIVSRCQNIEHIVKFAAEHNIDRFNYLIHQIETDNIHIPAKSRFVKTSDKSRLFREYMDTAFETDNGTIIKVFFEQVGVKKYYFPFFDYFKKACEKDNLSLMKLSFSAPSCNIAKMVLNADYLQIKSYSSFEWLYSAYQKPDEKMTVANLCAIGALMNGNIDLSKKILPSADKRTVFTRKNYEHLKNAPVESLFFFDSMSRIKVDYYPILKNYVVNDQYDEVVNLMQRKKLKLNNIVFSKKEIMDSQQLIQHSHDTVEKHLINYINRISKDGRILSLYLKEYNYTRGSVQKFVENAWVCSQYEKMKNLYYEFNVDLTFQNHIVFKTCRERVLFAWNSEVKNRANEFSIWLSNTVHGYKVIVHNGIVTNWIIIDIKQILNNTLCYNQLLEYNPKKKEIVEDIECIICTEEVCETVKLCPHPDNDHYMCFECINSIGDKTCPVCRIISWPTVTVKV